MGSFEPLENVAAFFHMGGSVLYPLFGVTLLMWAFILERFCYFWFVQGTTAAVVREKWSSRADHNSWFAKQIRSQLISEAGEEAKMFLSVIKTLVGLCPLLGLLGTVTGMIEVFDIMALVGTGNVRAMASGVSKATIPTMAGMTAALSGVYFVARLDARARRVVVELEDQLAVS